jgi:hypothetical protein
VRFVSALVAAACLLTLPGPVLAQRASPWTADLSSDRAAVSSGGDDSTWTTTRVQAMWSRPDAGGWLTAVDISTRGSLDDVTVSTRRYRRLGDWTFAAGAGVTPHADFLYRAAADAELSRRIFGTVVASGAYRFLTFTTADIHHPQGAHLVSPPRRSGGARLLHAQRHGGADDDCRPRANRVRVERAHRHQWRLSVRRSDLRHLVASVGDRAGASGVRNHCASACRAATGWRPAFRRRARSRRSRIDR